MALGRQEDEHTVAKELTRASEEAKRREEITASPPSVAVIFVIDRKVLPAIELPPLSPSDVYTSQLVTFKSGHLEEERLSFTVHVSGATINYHMEKK